MMKRLLNTFRGSGDTPPPSPKAMEQFRQASNALQEEASQLGIEIEQALRDILSRHQSANGWTPARISVAMQEVTAEGEEIPRYDLAKVKVVIFREKRQRAQDDEDESGEEDDEET